MGRNQKKILEKQKEKGDKVDKRKPPQQQQQKQQQQQQQQQDVPLVPQTPPKFAKNKWKEENDKMGDILEQYKKRRKKKQRKKDNTKFYVPMPLPNKVAVPKPLQVQRNNLTATTINQWMQDKSKLKMNVNREE